MRLRHGPSEYRVLPRGSIILCWNCGEAIGRTTGEIEKGVAVLFSKRVDLFHAYGGVSNHAGFCRLCGNSIFSSAGLINYFPIECLPSKIIEFMMGLDPLGARL